MSRKPGRKKELLADTAISNFADMLIKHEQFSRDIFVQLETELFKLGFDLQVNDHSMWIKKREDK